jgi:hypothetical protein
MRCSIVLACAAAIMVLSTAFAGATIRISDDRGGRIIDYAARFLETRASGEQVIIDGACLSACTLVVGMLPRDRVCATSRAVLGFHAAWRPTSRGGKTSSAIATQAMLDVYPSEVRSWIARHGGLTPRLILLRGRELAAIVPSCGSSAPVAVNTPRLPRAVGATSRANLAVRPSP